VSLNSLLNKDFYPGFEDSNMEPMEVDSNNEPIRVPSLPRRSPSYSVFSHIALSTQQDYEIDPLNEFQQAASFQELEDDPMNNTQQTLELEEATYVADSLFLRNESFDLTLTSFQ
jgi:hypothetical protein